MTKTVENLTETNENSFVSDCEIRTRTYPSVPALLITNLLGTLRLNIAPMHDTIIIIGSKIFKHFTFSLLLRYETSTPWISVEFKRGVSPPPLPPSEKNILKINSSVAKLLPLCRVYSQERIMYN